MGGGEGRGRRARLRHLAVQPSTFSTPPPSQTFPGLLFAVDADSDGSFIRMEKPLFSGCSGRSRHLSALAASPGSKGQRRLPSLTSRDGRPLQGVDAGL